MGLPLMPESLCWAEPTEVPIVRSRGMLALLAGLLVAVCVYAESLHDPDMTSWGLLWYQGQNTAFDPRWWHGIGRPALLIGLPTALVAGLAAFGLTRGMRRLLKGGQHNPGMETDRNA